MWPMFVDYSDLECRQTLRSLELDAYASIVNAFRAQGALTEDKKTMLKELSSALSIPVERHKAEMRRVANDEHLNTVAERLYGPFNNIDWSKEGRRLKPLRPCPSCNEDVRKFAAKVRQGEHNEDSDDDDDDELDLSDGAGARQVRNIFEAIMGHKRAYPFTYDEATPSKVTVHSNPVTDQPGPSGFKSSTSDVPITTAAVSVKGLFMPHSSPQASSSASFKIPPSPACAASTASSLEASQEASSSASVKIPPSPACAVSTASSVEASQEEVVNCSSATTMSAAATSMVATSTVSTTATINGNGSLLVTKEKSSDPVLSTTPEERSSVSPVKSTVNDSQVTAASSSLLKTLAMVALSAKTYTPSAATDSSVLTAIKVSESEVASKSASKAQILPSHVGLAPSPQVSVRPEVLSLTPRIKAHDLNTIPKVAPVLVSTSVSQASRSLPASSQSQPEFKVPFPVHKPLAAKSHQIKIQTLANTQSGAKASSLPENVNQKPQLVAGSFFPAFSKSGSKASGPIIACVPLRVPSTTSKDKADRPTIQILPKTATVGIIRNPIKMGTSSIRTVQQKEGGLVKTAHIVNISPPAGSRQPSTSSSGLATTGLCVTLPSGTRKALAVRASSPSKPNVIVVHKAQWTQPKVVSTPAAASKSSNAEETEKTFIASIEETEICDGGLSLKFPIKEEIVED